ncbi:MAG TPA: prepilin-type N-terminal cleavage/methylation domain-containing protein [Abditibacteriaceae bacterium]|jgi:prepilin-type N-terminal cleavage/methylation domain-containing protein
MRQTRRYSSQRNHGFTLIEIMIALSLFLVLLAVIFIPLNQAFQVFNAGRTSIALQGAADNTVKTIAAELQGAIAVYPNSELPGITDRQPYSTTGSSRAPYFDTTACSGGRVSNTARIDFLLPMRDPNTGTVGSPIRPENYVVTYYARLFTPADGFSTFTNPIGIYRAQMPYQEKDGTPLQKMNLLSADNPTRKDRYEQTPAGVCDADWLVQTSVAGSPPTPQISSLTGDSSDGVPGSEALITPRDMGVNLVDMTIMQPDLNFTCEDVDSNGVIDRVTITLTLVQYEGGDGGRKQNGQLLGQRVTASQVVNLPNTRLGV